MYEIKKSRACLYSRLSQADGDRTESDSIVSQKLIMREYVACHPDIEIVSEKADDGYSGTDFNRPGFLEMMGEVRAGRVNCIIVKDLSRFGRNYIDVGIYQEQVFPIMGVRFIAINDNYDSMEKQDQASWLVPMKNLINEAYCMDLSLKQRAQQKMKRQHGKYTGTNPVYGYSKDPKNHYHLIPDPDAADIVRSIFQWYLQGMSIGRIVSKLNREDVLSPLEYKISKGIWASTSFRSGKMAHWAYPAVRRILEDEVYIGVLVQGKTMMPSHKAKRSIPKRRDDWIRVEGTHEPIIDEYIFWAVQDQLKKSILTPKGRTCAYPFSGYLTCPNCGQNMIRKAVSDHGIRYCYYRCVTFHTGCVCTSHTIREEDLEALVIEAIREKAVAVDDLLGKLRAFGEITPECEYIMRYDRLVSEKRQECDKIQCFMRKLDESLRDGTIRTKECEVLRKNYVRRIEEMEDSIRRIEQQKTDLIRGEGKTFVWMLHFAEYRNITKLDRETVVKLIDHIKIWDAKRIEVHFRYEEEFRIMSVVPNLMGCTSGNLLRSFRSI